MKDRGQLLITTITGEIKHRLGRGRTKACTDDLRAIAWHLVIVVWREQSDTLSARSRVCFLCYGIVDAFASNAPADKRTCEICVHTRPVADALTSLLGSHLAPFLVLLTLSFFHLSPSCSFPALHVQSRHNFHDCIEMLCVSSAVRCVSKCVHNVLFPSSSSCPKNHLQSHFRMDPESFSYGPPVLPTGHQMPILSSALFSSSLCRRTLPRNVIKMISRGRQSAEIIHPRDRLHEASISAFWAEKIASRFIALNALHPTTTTIRVLHGFLITRQTLSVVSKRRRTMSDVSLAFCPSFNLQCTAASEKMAFPVPGTDFTNCKF